MMLSTDYCHMSLTAVPTKIIHTSVQLCLTQCYVLIIAVLLGPIN